MNINPENSFSSNITPRPKKLGQLLIEAKRLTPGKLSIALQEQERINGKSKRHFKLGEILMFMKVLSLKDLHNHLLKQRPRSHKDRENIVKVGF